MKFFKYLLFFLFITSFSSFAQQFRFKTTQMTVLEKDNKNNWGKWSTPEKTEMYVTLDYDKDKIVIYSREIQHYTIVEYLDKEKNKIDNLIYKQKTLIEKLKEYRASIISHAVTGKIDVREFGA